MIPLGNKIWEAQAQKSILLGRMPRLSVPGESIMINKVCHGHKEESFSNRHIFAIPELDVKGIRNRPEPTRSTNSSKHHTYITFPHSSSFNQVPFNEIKRTGKNRIGKETLELCLAKEVTELSEHCLPSTPPPCPASHTEMLPWK